MSRKLEILQRLGKTEEARSLIRETIWYRCGSLYYKPSAKIILDGTKVIKGDLDLKKCLRVPFSQMDALEAKVGIIPMPSVSTPKTPKGGCCT